MNIKFIGTGAILTSSNSACYLIDEHILIDCGAGNMKALMAMGYDIYKIDTMFITHLHSDHFWDIPHFMLARSFEAIENRLTVYGPPGLKEACFMLFRDFVISFPTEAEELYEKAKIDFVEVEELKNQEFMNEYYVSTYSMEHGPLPIYLGYTITKDNKTIGFSGDTRCCKGLEEMIEHSDVAVIDCCFPMKSRIHINPEELEELAKKYPSKKFYGTHNSYLIKQISNTITKDNVIIPEDGDEIIL